MTIKQTLIISLSSLILASCAHQKTTEAEKNPIVVDDKPVMESYYDMESIANKPQAAVLDLGKQHAIILTNKRNYVVVKVSNYKTATKDTFIYDTQLSDTLKAGITYPDKTLNAPIDKQRKSELEEKSYIVYFDSDKSSLDTKTINTLQQIVKENSSQSQIYISGYADQDGSDKYNLNLSKKRAKAVSHYFNKSGFNNIKSNYFGEAHLADPSNTDEAKAKNRRAVIDIKGEVN